MTVQPKETTSMKRINLFSIFAVAALLFAAPAVSQTTLLDQNPAPVPSVTNALTPGQSELLTQYQTVPGGGLYQSILKQPGPTGQIIGVASSFVPGGAGALTRYL